MSHLVVQGIAIPFANKLASEFAENSFDYLKNLLASNSVVINQPEPGAVWISVLEGTWGLWNGNVASCYFHPSKPHSATTVGKLGEKTSQAEAGEWAVSMQTKGLFGNKTFKKNL